MKGTYVGEFRNGTFDGQGTYTFAAGSRYVGEFRDGYFNGHGRFTMRNGEFVYDGEFLAGLPSGHGTATFADGTVRIGEFRNGKFNGQTIFRFADAMPAPTYSCPDPPSSYWDYCTGTRTFPDGNKYVGEFRDDKPNGHGTYTIADGTRQVGEFKDGRYLGPTCPDPSSSYWDNCIGTRIFPSGDTYTGEFHNNALTGQGTRLSANGTKYVGEFRENQRNGHGTITFANGDKYVGDFRDDKFSGYGTHTFANGDLYVGEFREDNLNGQGTYTFRNGEQQVGQFRNGKYQGPSTSPAPVQGESSFEVHLDRKNGVLLVPVVINNKILLDFIIDSGASDVSMPVDVVSTLRRTGTLADTDFTGTKTYVLADGSTMPSATFRIRSLRVGDRVLENISGSVAPLEGPLLLGQSFLSRFKAWSVDNLREVLVLR
jgi:hypothetical protein